MFVNKKSEDAIADSFIAMLRKLIELCSNSFNDFNFNYSDRLCFAFNFFYFVTLVQTVYVE